MHKLGILAGLMPIMQISARPTNKSNTVNNGGGGEESASRVDRGIESRAIGCLNGLREPETETAEAAVSPRAALFADIRETTPPFSLSSSFLPSPGLNGASRGSSIGGGNPSNVPVGLCQSAFQKRTMLHSAFGKFILAWKKWRGERPNSCISPPCPPPRQGPLRFLGRMGGEGGSKQKGRSRKLSKVKLKNNFCERFLFLVSYPFLSFASLVQETKVRL